MADTQTISGEKLCVLTGLTDRRHRQIAKSGYFPPPIKGQYQLTATLQGMFKYYRELGERTRDKRDKIDDEKHRKLKLENDEKDGLLTNTQDLANQIAPAMTKFRNDIYDALQNEAALAMASIGVPEARIVGGRIAEKLLTKMQSAFRSWKL